MKDPLRFLAELERLARERKRLQKLAVKNPTYEAIRAAQKATHALHEKIDGLLSQILKSFSKQAGKEPPKTGASSPPESPV